MFVKSNSKKNSPEYKLEFTLCDLNDHILSEETIVGEYQSWFDTQGLLVPSKFAAFVQRGLVGDDKKTK